MLRRSSALVVRRVTRLAQPPVRLSNASTRSLSASASRSAFARRSQLWIPTEKENPADAAIPSHQLLIRGGFIRKSGHGTFSFLPLGKRVLAKLEAIIDDEMAAIQGNKIDLPLLISADLWKISGRWQTRGPELIAFEDRRGDMQTLAPTHEESVTSLVAAHYTNSNASLRLYQIGKKFRDEIRPRFGLLRGREFIMKDMYSFDTSFANALVTYEDVVGAYETILRERLQLEIAKVEADSGNIGGNLSHEFHVLAAIGEDGLLSCDGEECGYAANVEKAVGTLDEMDQGPKVKGTVVVACAMDLTQRLESLQGRDAWNAIVETFLSEESAVKYGIKCRVFAEGSGDGETTTKHPRLAVVFVRGDRDVNDLLLKPFFNGEEMQPVKELSASTFSSPEGLQVFVDDSLSSESLQQKNPLVALLHNQATSHSSADLLVHSGHFRVANECDGCPKCATGKLQAKRGIEVGHVFYLGQKYSKPFEVTFTAQEDEAKKPVQKVMEMGCFGMGVSRLLAAVVESFHDTHGIIWPEAIAPYKVIVLSIGGKKAEDPVSQAALCIAQDLATTDRLGRGDVLLDDRWNESPGSKLTEAELIGYPYRVVVGKRFVKEGLVEVLTRASMEKTFLPPSELATFFQQRTQAD